MHTQELGAQTVCDLLAIYAGIGPPALDVRDAAARQLERTVDSAKAERVKVSSATHRCTAALWCAWTSTLPLFSTLARLTVLDANVLVVANIFNVGDCPLRGVHCNLSSSTVKPEKKRVRLHSVDSLAEGADRTGTKQVSASREIFF